MTPMPEFTQGTLVRLPDWRLRFDALIAERLRAPFAWGTNDCALFAADNVRALTGFDPAFGLRAHRSARQAARTLRRRGDLATLVDLHVGPSCAPGLAVQGDVVMVPMNTESVVALRWACASTPSRQWGPVHMDCCKPRWPTPCARGG